GDGRRAVLRGASRPVGAGEMSILQTGRGAGTIETRPHVVTRRLLMCAPAYYGIHYEINAWMDRRQGADVALAGRQWEALSETLPCGGILWAGYHFRTDVRSHWRLSEILGVPTMSLELVDERFYHLDTCFCPLDEETAIYYPAAFDDYANRVLQAHVPRLIAA